MRLVHDKETGKNLWLDEREATVGLVEGRYWPVKEDQYLVTDETSGYTGKVEPKDLIRYLQRGYRLADENETIRFEERDSPVKAALLGAADIVAGGAIHPAAQLLDELELTEDLGPQVRAIREQNPGATIAGQVAGIAASLPATAARAVAGTGKVAEAYRAAMTFPRVAAAAGEFAARKGAALATRAGAGQLATKVAETAARGVGEGAFYGFAHGLSEADMGDPSDVAEQLIAGTGTGALLGGGIGAALPVAGHVVSSSVRGAGRGLASLYGAAANTTPAKGLGQALEGAVVAMQRRFHPEKAHLIDALENKAVREEIADPELIEKFAKQMAVKVGNGVGALDDGIDRMWKLKYRNAERLVKPENQAASIAASADAVMKIGSGAERMAIDVEEMGAEELDARLYQFGRVQPVVNKLRRIGDAVLETVNNKGVDAASSFRAINQARRDVDELIDWKAIKSGASRTREQRNVDDVLIGVRGDLAKMLESEPLWGPQVARQQRALNQLYKRHKEGENLFQQQLMAKLGRDRYIPDPQKIRNYLNDPQAGANLRRNLAYKDFVGEQREAAKILRDYYEGGGQMAQILDHSADEMDKLFGDLEGKLGLRNQLDDWMEAAQQGQLSRAMVGGLSPVIAGAVAGGLPGAVAGAAFRVGAEAMLNPVRWHLGLANVNRLRLAAEAHIRDAARAIVIKAPRAGRVWPGLRRALTPSAMTVLRTSGEERQRAVEAKIAEYHDYSSHPEAVRERVIAAVGPAADVTPGVMNALALRLVEAASYMVSVAPRTAAGATLFGEAPRLSDVEIDKFARQMAVAEDPLVVLDRMREGTLTVDETRALRGMYPDLYRRIQASILDYIGKEGLGDVPFARRMQVGILFDMPTDPSLLPANMVRYQQSTKAMGSVAQPQRQPAKTRKLTEGQTKRLVGSEQSAMSALEAR